MKPQWVRTVMQIGVLFVMLGGTSVMALADDANDKALPKAWEKIKEVGREARHEFSQATRKTAGAIKKAVKGENADHKPTNK